MKPIDASRIVSEMGQDSPFFPFRFGTHPAAPGWVTNGHWLAFVGEARVRGAGPWDRDMPGLLKQIRQGLSAAMPAVEDQKLRIPAGISDVGQRVYRSGTIRVVAADRYACLLEGLTVVLAEKSAESPLLGLDTDGDLVAVVMPVRWEGPVRHPKETLS